MSYDLIARLRALAEQRHDDLTTAHEAADALEAMQADVERLAWHFGGAKTDSDAMIQIELRLLNGDVPTLDEVRQALDAAMKAGITPPAQTQPGARWRYRLAFAAPEPRALPSQPGTPLGANVRLGWDMACKAGASPQPCACNAGLRAAQPKRDPLTDEQIEVAMYGCLNDWDWREFARAIERSEGAGIVSESDVGNGPNPLYGGCFEGETQELADLRRSQAAEIAKLTALNSALTDKGNSYIIDNAKLTAERDAAKACADAAIERCAQVCEDVEASAWALWKIGADPIEQGRNIGAQHCAHPTTTRSEP